VAAFCVGMVEDVDASGHVYSLDRTFAHVTIINVASKLIIMIDTRMR
jgi:hypothetical protein